MEITSNLQFQLMSKFHYYKIGYSKGIGGSVQNHLFQSKWVQYCTENYSFLS